MIMTKSTTQPGSKKYERDFGDWVDAFIEATNQTTAPQCFRLWGAISCIAGVLERKVHVHTLGSNLYPNLYVILCARPGVGKTEVTDRVRQAWTSVDGLHIASANMSRASLTDSLQDAKVVSGAYEYNALLASVNELGVLLPSYDLEFMSHLTDLYDCKVYTERKRGGGLKINIPNPYLNMLCGTQPGFLHSLLPEVAWEQGFMSRCILVYSGEKIQQDLFTVSNLNLERLYKDLNLINNMSGRFKWADDAKDYINRWHLSGGEPRPSHPKLSNYNERRTAHVLKLCQVASASQGGSMLIEEAHVKRSVRWLTEAEANMEDIFKTMSSGGDSATISEAFHYLWTTFVREGKRGVAASRLNAFLMDRTDAYKVRHVIEIMERSGMIKTTVIEGKTAYIPQAKGGEKR